MHNAIENLIKQRLAISLPEAEDHTEILINAFDQEHKIIFWNKKAETYFGINKEAAVGNKIEDLIQHAAKNKKLKFLKAALQGNLVHVAKDKYDKQAAYYEQWVIPVKENGDVVAALNIIRDIQ